MRAVVRVRVVEMRGRREVKAAAATSAAPSLWLQRPFYIFVLPFFSSSCFESDQVHHLRREEDVIGGGVGCHMLLVFSNEATTTAMLSTTTSESNFQ